MDTDLIILILKTLPKIRSSLPCVSNVVCLTIEQERLP